MLEARLLLPAHHLLLPARSTLCWLILLRLSHLFLPMAHQDVISPQGLRLQQLLGSRLVVTVRE